MRRGPKAITPLKVVQLIDPMPHAQGRTRFHDTDWKSNVQRADQAARRNEKSEVTTLKTQQPPIS